MKSIGIKLADGSFYPLLEEGNPEKKSIDLTTATDGQTKVHVDVYRSDTGTMEGAEYLDTLEMQDLKPHQTGEPTLDLSLDMDEDDELQAQITDSETGAKSGIRVTLASKGVAMPASVTNETPFDFDELEGDTQPDETASTHSEEDTAQPAPQETPEASSADDFDMSALDELTDEPFDFDASEPEKLDPSIKETTPEDEPPTDEAIPLAQDTAEDTTSDEEAQSAAELPAEEAIPVDQIPDVAETNEDNLDELDLDDTSDETSADDFDLEGLEQLGDLGAQDNPNESDEQIMVPDPASLVPEIEDIGDTSSEEAQEIPTSEADVPARDDATAQDETAAEDIQPIAEEIATEDVAPAIDEAVAEEAQPADELPAEEAIPVDQIPEVAETNEDNLDELNLDDTSDETSTDDFDLEGLEQLGDLGAQDNPNESDEQIMVPDPASLVPEIEDIGDDSSEEAQEIPTSEADVPARDDATAQDETAAELPAEEAIPVDQIPEVAETNEDNLDELDLGDIPAPAEPTDEIASSDLDDTSAQAQADSSSEEGAEPVEVVADTAEDLPTESELAQADEGDLEEVQSAEDTLPAQEADTADTSDDLGQLNGEPFDFDTTQEDAPTEDTPQAETSPAMEDTNDFGLGELAAMDFGSLAELPEDVESEPSAQEAPDASAAQSPTPDESLEAENVDDFQSPSIDDEEETASDEAADFDLPDFDDTSDAQGDTAEDFTLPDFDDDMGGSNLDFSGIFDDSPSSTDDKPNDDLIFSDEDLSLPDDFLSDTQEDSKGTLGDSGGLFNGLDKEGLYDKATLEGGSPSYSEDDDVKNKTKAPVVICVICAIICVLAAALMLLAELRPDLLKTTFFSKSESSKMASLIESVKSESQTQETTSQDAQAKPTGETEQKGSGDLSSNTTASSSQSAQEQAATSPSVEAKEDQIVVASTPEHVVPKAPEPNPQKAPDVRYKVVWGDTLWDISNAYYRTPWKFRHIASYNGIKDPDKIIAGTWLLLPAE